MERMKNMPEDYGNEAVAKKLLHALVQFQRLRNFPSREKKTEFERQCRHSEIMILFAVQEMETDHPQGVSISELSGSLRVKSPTVTPSVFLLEKMDLVARSTDQNDRRVIRIRLTDKGRRMISAHKQRFAQRIQGLVDYLGKEKSDTLANLLDEVYRYAISLSEPNRP